MNYLDYIQLGATFVLALGLLEVIKMLIGRMNNKENPMKGILQELQTISANHLTHIQDKLMERDMDLINTINDGNREIVASLGRIEGLLRGK